MSALEVGNETVDALAEIVRRGYITPSKRCYDFYEAGDMEKAGSALKAEALAYMLGISIKECERTYGHLMCHLPTSAPKTFVYLISTSEKPAPGDLVKVGYAAGTRKRLIGLQSGSAEQLHLIGSRPGGRRDEQAIHERHREARVRGEWFAATPELLAEFSS